MESENLSINIIFLPAFFLIKSIFSLLADKYNNKSVFLLNVDLLLSIRFLIFSEFLFPPGSLICIKKIFFFFEIPNNIIYMMRLSGAFDTFKYYNWFFIHFPKLKN